MVELFQEAEFESQLCRNVTEHFNETDAKVDHLSDITFHV